MRAASILSILLSALGLLGSCRGGTPGTDPRASGCSTPEPPTSASASSSAPPAASADPAPRVPVSLEPTCAADVDTAAAPPAQLAQLATQCAPGMTPHASNARLRNPLTTHDATIPVALEASTCVRVGAVPAAHNAVTELWLQTEQGARIAQAGPSRGPVMLGPRGPVCVRNAGTYVVGMRTWARDPNVHVGVWQSAPAPAPASSNPR